MTRAEAIERLSAYIGNSCYTVEHQEACYMAIAALREQEQSQWISVKERLPEDDVDVLTRRATGMGVESHCGFGWSFDEYNGKWIVTHWMPLPEPPNCDADMRGESDATD